MNTCQVCGAVYADAASVPYCAHPVGRSQTHETTPEESGQVGTLCLRNALGYAEEKDWTHAVVLLDEARIWLTAASDDASSQTTTSDEDRSESPPVDPDTSA